MGKEIERKYKLLYLPEITETGAPSVIQQAYIMFEGKKQLRVRILNEKFGFLTFKDALSNEVRDEYEYQIPLKDAQELYAKAEFKLTKFRYNFKSNSFHVDIDLLPNGRRVVELEAEDINQFDVYALPSFCGEEVTTDPEYSNIAIAKQFSK